MSNFAELALARGARSAPRLPRTRQQGRLPASKLAKENAPGNWEASARRAPPAGKSAQPEMDT